MSHEQSRPPAGNFDPAIKAMLYIAGGLLTMEIVGLGVSSHEPAPESTADASASVGQTTSKDKGHIHPMMSPASSTESNTNTNLKDYLVPAGIVALETRLAIGVVRRYKASKHPFNQPFSQPDIEYYPFNEEENKAFEAIKANLEAKS